MKANNKHDSPKVTLVAQATLMLNIILQISGVFPLSFFRLPQNNEITSKSLKTLAAITEIIH